MRLWREWFGAVAHLRPACIRWRTYAWMVLVLAGLSIRSDLAGVTSFVRVLGLAPAAYRRLLHVLHSPALRLDQLTVLWTRWCRDAFPACTVGGARVCLADGLKAPQGLLVTTDSVYWAETRPAAVPGIACVPVLQPLSLIYAADRALQSRRLLVVAENAETHFGGKLLGERDGQLYWVQQFGQQYNRAVTTVSRLPVQGGDPEELVRVLGSQDAALGRSVLYWTAPSEERMPPESARTVYRRALAGGEPEKLTDWMALRGVLLVLGDRPLYCDDRVVWRVPDHLAEPVPLASLRVEPATVSMAHGTLYGYRMDEKLRHVVRCPLTLAARLRGLLRLI